MELRQLEYFVAVAEDANFTRAAERLHVSQPGVSAQIRRLERELGQELLDRSGRTVSLTDVGAAVLPYARAALDAVHRAQLTVDEFTGLIRGKVAVGLLTACPAIDLADLLATFHKAHPAVEIALSEDTSDRLLEALQDGRLDLALVGLAADPPPGTATRVIVDESLVAAVSHGHALFGKTSLAMAALQEYPLITLPQGTGLRACLDRAAADAGVRPRIAFEASDLRVLAQLAARGLGVAILPASVAEADARLHPITATHPPLRSRIELAWRTHGPIGPAAKALLDLARATI